MVNSNVWLVGDLQHLLDALAAADAHRPAGEFSNGYQAAVDDIRRMLGLRVVDERPQIRIIEGKAKRW